MTVTTHPDPFGVDRLLAGWFDPEGECPMCEEISTIFAAVEIVIDGDQIAESCPGCGRRVRPFSWHDTDGLPTEYLGHGPDRFGRVQVYAWYHSGAVGSVPEIDDDDPTQTEPAGPMPADVVGRAVLAHLVGLDVTDAMAEAFQAEVIDGVLDDGDGEWVLEVDEVIEWLEVNR